VLGAIGCLRRLQRLLELGLGLLKLGSSQPHASLEELVHLLDALLVLDAAGDIAEDAGDKSAVADGHFAKRQLEPERAAIFPTALANHVRRAEYPLQRAYGLVGPLLNGTREFAWNLHELLDFLALDLLGGVTEDPLGGLVPLLNDAALVEGDDAVGRGAQD